MSILLASRVTRRRRLIYMYLFLTLFVFFFQVTKDHWIRPNELFLEEFCSFERILPTHGLPVLVRLLKNGSSLIFVHVFYYGTHTFYDVGWIVGIVAYQHEFEHGSIL